MKFSRTFKEVLAAEGFPPTWLEAAVPYSQLKKCIKRVEGELQSLGLDVSTLAHLSTPNAAHGDLVPGNAENGAIAFQYRFGDASPQFLPRLTLFFRLIDGVAIDAALTPETRRYLERLVPPPQDVQATNSEMQQDLDNCSCTTEESVQNMMITTPDKRVELSHTWQVDVPLVFDGEFFGLLQKDVSTLDALQCDEQKALSNEILALGAEMAKLTGPAKYAKTDTTAWRKVFESYLQANIFFSTNELDHGSRNSATALKQLQWFQSEIARQQVIKSFKIRSSRVALEKFMTVNMVLLKNLKYQEINQLAISKILKKFDKRTALGARNSLPKIMPINATVTQRMAKAVCAEISREIVKLVPQLDDYLCPVCFSISYKPVRLACKHVFCIRCMILMQKQRARHCPLCRDDVIMDADGANLDISLALYLKKYFPAETKAKQRENEIAAGVDKYGPAFTEAKCVLM